MLGWPEGRGYWAILKHADVAWANREPRLFSSNLGATQIRDPKPEDLEFQRRMMLNLDPPEHTRLRRIEEMLRFASPVMCFRRTASADVELRGRKIAAGDKVVLYYASANFDEEAFTRPERFDVARDPNPHFSLGEGPHFCLGAHLARLQMRIFFEEVLRELPDFTVAGPIERLQSNFQSGIKHMPVTFTAKPG